ncbi:CvfD/Ygs/GSP13 family RNA-binding post-transcriptional regulator [Effusibacillus lacus]|uniref:RNA-binding protein n=1 Tax=Effusibacillus lacus TaxID=1348429 RepID=A0A292YHL8_9BACL|nr:CvfD/Ygs/GSP13 family RNA-binding post-transcriptional regulator [Effusibacillus lacus]TCS74582.1 general stress protein 13/S1 RNA binding domain protein [Effusibacillus lacus]GAX88456.1 RNA-binding protein [Effusibacillus lacus]
MPAAIEPGSIIEGSVVSVKPFGVFVQVDENRQGLVHISQVSHSYVKDINEHIKVGETVKVKVVSIDPDTGKISLSIKEATPKPAAERTGRRPQKQTGKQPGFNSFEDQMKKWLKHSEENLAALNKKLNR